MDNTTWKVELTKGEAIQVRVGARWRSAKVESLHIDENSNHIMVGYSFHTDLTERIHYVDVTGGRVRKWGEGEERGSDGHEGEGADAQSPPLGASNSWIKRQRKKQQEIRRWHEKAEKLSGMNSENRSPKTR